MGFKEAIFDKSSLKQVFQIAPFANDPTKLMTVVDEDNSDSQLLLACADPDEIYALEFASDSNDSASFEATSN